MSENHTIPRVSYCDLAIAQRVSERGIREEYAEENNYMGVTGNLPLDNLERPTAHQTDEHVHRGGWQPHPSIK